MHLPKTFLDLISVVRHAFGQLHHIPIQEVYEPHPFQKFLLFEVWTGHVLG